MKLAVIVVMTIGLASSYSCGFAQFCIGVQWLDPNVSNEHLHVLSRTIALECRSINLLSFCARRRHNPRK